MLVSIAAFVTVYAAERFSDQSRGETRCCLILCYVIAAVAMHYELIA